MKNLYNIRKSLWILFCCMSLLAANGIPATLHAQERKRLTVEMTDAPILDVLKAIEAQSELSFFYNNNLIDPTLRITVSKRDAPIPEVLNRVFAGTPYAYRIVDKQVLISKKEDAPKSDEPLKIQGRVIDSKGGPIVGATVVNMRTLQGTVTGSDGRFELTVSALTEELTFNYIGFKTKVLPASNAEEVRLEEATVLEDVVVVGYGTVKRVNLTGSVATIDMREKANQPITNTAQAMYNTPGVWINQNNAKPGADGGTIRIRGVNTLSSANPLVLLDGVEYDINEINPADIESISVLKDASATAIYGVQAANGVIVVTTKKGRNGPAQVTYNGSVSINQRENYRRLYLMDASERVQLSKDLLDSRLSYTRKDFNLGYEMLKAQYDAKKLTRSQFDAAVTEMIDRNTDWFDLLFRNAVTQNHTLSLSGGNESTTYYSSVGASISQGTAREEVSKRYTATLKVNSWISPKVYIGFQLNGSITDNQGYHSSFNPDSYARETARTIPAYNADGSLFFYRPYESFSTSNMANQTYAFNALHESQTTGNYADLASLTGLMNFVWKIYDGLRYEMTGSYVYNATKTTTWAQEDSYYVNQLRGYVFDELEFGSSFWNESVIPQGGVLSKSEATKTTLDIRNTLSYSKDFKGHLVSALATSEIRSVITDGFSGTHYGWMPERGQVISPSYTDAYIVDLKNGAFTPVITDNRANTVSWIFSGIYSYKDKYTLNANVRMDGSNQFGENPKYRFLPIWSVAGKYALTNEAFMKPYEDWLSYLALRLSYGIQGNVDKGTSPDLVMQIGSIDSNTGMATSTVAYWPNEDLRWEKTTQYNVGLDFSFLLDRITATVDFYKKVGTDMIVNKTISAVNGYTIRKINGGNVNNSGVELAVKFTPLQTKDMRLVIGFVHSYNKNELIKANDETNNTRENMLSGSALIEGEALGTIYSYPFAGLDHETGLPVFYDKKGNTSATWLSKTYKNYTLYEDEIELVKSGVVSPPHTGGINLEYRWKEWILRGSFTYSLGAVNRLPFIYGDYDSVFDPEKNVTREILNRWREPGDELHTNIPALYDDNTYTNLGVRPMRANVDHIYGTSMYDYSTARVCSTNNLRLRSLSLSYIFNKKMLKKMHLSNFQISAQANNLFIIADKRWHGFDPEQGSSANSSIPRTYSLSVTIGF